MRWRQPAYLPLAEAIVASFGQSAAHAQLQLASFSAAQWRRTWFWLDASGLALYFLHRVEELHLLSTLDPSTLEHLRARHADNRERSAGLLQDFIALNREFAKRGILYVNLKGFTLCPHSCPAPDLRLQLDFDFLVPQADLATCRAILEGRGFRLSAATCSTWEFKANDRADADLSNPYKNTPLRSVELHSRLHGMNSEPTSTRDLLNRRMEPMCSGQRIPALSPADQFISQALHILGHLRSASTRPAWLLEFRNHVNARAQDLCFWFDVQQLARRNPVIPVAIGASISLADDLFGLILPAAVENWLEHSLPLGVTAWLQHYGRRAVLADFPGTKLYLLLETELGRANLLPDAARQPSPLPALRIPRLFPSQPGEAPRRRLRRWWIQTCYFFFRLRFHVSEGLLYSVESHRWSRRPSDLSASVHARQTLTKRKQLRDNSRNPVS